MEEVITIYPEEEVSVREVFMRTVSYIKDQPYYTPINSPTT